MGGEWEYGRRVGEWECGMGVRRGEYANRGVWEEGTVGSGEMEWDGY